jgi:hypothetical protein
MTHDIGSGANQRVVIGRATTHRQALPLGVDDPVVAARAVRRALADARRRAADVESLAIAARPPLTRDAVMRFARRALGPFGADLEPVIVEALEPSAGALVDVAIRALSMEGEGQGLAVAVGISTDGTTIAVCLSAPRLRR